MKNDLVTKDDLKKTADGLHKEIAAVKTELHSEIDSVKDSLQKNIERVAIQVVHSSNDFNEFKQETRQQHNMIITAIDGLARLITNGQTEKMVVDHALQRHDHQLEDHETRISVLEKNIK